MPIIIYNVPGRTGANISAETTLRLAHDFQNIVAIKEASGNFKQIDDIIKNKPANFMVISGDDGITVELIKRGGDGVISVAANGFPKVFCNCIHEAMAGNITDAESTLNSLLESINLLFKEGNPTGIKTMTHAMGITRSEVRLPLVEGSKILKADMERIIKEKSLQ